MGNGGSYPCTPKVELLDDGRIVRLLTNFVYIDPGTVRWTAPKDTQADGASIPRPLWSLIGGPFEGKYRNASIVHDFYCSKRNKPWKDVHRMFYDAMITSGVGTSMAKLLYGGVYFGGPRWTALDINNASIPFSMFEKAVEEEQTAFPREGMGYMDYDIDKKRRMRAKKRVEYKYHFGDDDLRALKKALSEDNDLDEIEAKVDILQDDKPREWRY